MSLAKNLMLGAWGIVGTLGLMTLVGAGCTTEETIDPGHLPFETEEAFCTKAAEVVCNANVVDNCYGSDDASRADDTNLCRARYKIQTSCNPNNFDYHQPGAQQCLDALSAVYADARIDKAEEAQLQVACLTAFNDGGKEGASCAVDNDCDAPGGFRCVFAPEGTCQIPEEVAGGLSCGGAKQVCIDDLYCGAGAAGDICQQRPGPGGMCSDLIPCSEDALCVIPMGMTEGVCETKDANGETCQTPDQCIGGYCQIPTGGTDGTCAARLTLGSTTAGSCDPFL